MVLLRKSPVLALRASSCEALAAPIDRLDRFVVDPELDRATAISVKINLCDARTAETGATTDPRFLDALLGWLRARNPAARLFVTESDGLSVLGDRYRQWFGVNEVLARWDASWLNLSEQPIVQVPIRGRHLKQVPIPRPLLESYVVSLSKLKTNLLSVMTCALKNQFGCLPQVDKFKLHPWLADVIVDVNLALRPRLFVVDGIVGHGGIQGPSFGIPIRAGVILAGSDPVAVDAACCHVMGYSPLLVSHVRKAWLSGVGSLRYELHGDPLPRVDFENHGLEIAIFRWGGRIKRWTQKRDRRALA